MNILYLHGLDSSLNVEKRAILEKYGTVYSPQIDYRNDESSIESLINLYKDKDIDSVIGSSMGGFAAYYIADKFQRPALLFNPALAYRSVHQNIPDIKNPLSNLKHLVLGAKDEVVDPKSTLEFLSNSIGIDNYNIKIRQDLQHRIPEEIFEVEVKAFFKKLLLK
ncbi:YqiA/YcfP family alpha/beta fold hydrolase [Aequorivita sp. KMM 9714]|uniref:YqiA/YcfP family alpha/beta fold hydrolase n=1 Tax=Aequorivita sp. KMM 9714 TaxID=2707173 RepID=UPI0013ECF5B7|nr:YqiA/YcfP family alpha/beta fold hydrolase [Aequorivita sp. KMM 9714]NGX85332.1 alpha/beta hydrolase [Aequorivita sp. KMM 9714]